MCSAGNMSGLMPPISYESRERNGQGFIDLPGLSVHFGKPLSASLVTVIPHNNDTPFCKLIAGSTPFQHSIKIIFYLNKMPL